MFDKYIIKNGKRLRYGYTTGSCAAAAAKAAAKMLFSGKEISTIKIDTPKGWELELSVKDIVITKDYVSCCIIKDSGDDPDSTNGIKIYAKVQRNNKDKVEITGGAGIGKVTKPGLSVKVGKYAINPVPMKMIENEVKKVLKENEGVKVTIYAPEGAGIAKKTFNPKLGIVGGISIIGTSGIVEPMSEEALKQSLAIELSVFKEQGKNKVIFVPGNYGRDFALKYGLHEKFMIKTSNYIGFMLDKASEYGIKKILWIGHIGKMVKIASGIFNTHSKVADARMETLAAYTALYGGNKELIQKIMSSITTDEAAGYIKKAGLDIVFNKIAERISKRSEERTFNTIKVGTIIFSLKYGKLGACPYSRYLMEEFISEQN